MDGSFEFLTPFTLGGYNFLIFNPFLTILNVLDAPRRGLQFFLDTRTNRAFPGLVYPIIVVEFNVQLSWFMRFAMEIFIPYLLASILILINL
jgi:hypothetical protein